MALPFDYTGKLDVKLTSPEAKEGIMTELYHFLKKSDEIRDIKLENNRIGFIFKSLFTISYEVELFFSPENSLIPKYKVKLTQLIQVCIALVVFIALFSKLRISGYLWFSSVFLLVFFFLNLVFTDKLLGRLIASFHLFYDDKTGYEGQLTDEQKQWIKDPTKCPACGQEISEYDILCPDCGLKLRVKAPASPINVTGYKTKRFKYFYRERKKDKHGS